ncbi:MAG: GNAT family N-acetyltransferase [Verrucomicrobiota bacterium]
MGLQKLAFFDLFGHVLELGVAADLLFKKVDSAVRRAVRKAERAGVKTEVSDQLDALKSYYVLHCATRKRHGLPPQPFRFFEELHRQIFAKGLACTILARHQGLLVAGAVFLQYGRKALFKFGASDLKHQSLRANDLVIWRAIEQFANRGCTKLHFGRTSKANAGLRRFKLGWGTREYEIRYFKYDLKHSAFVKDRDNAFGWHNRLLRLMPTWLARAAGSILYKRFA